MKGSLFKVPYMTDYISLTIYNNKASDDRILRNVSITSEASHSRVANTTRREFESSQCK